MTHHFDLATFKSVDIAECQPGFYFQLTNFAGPAKPILKVDSEAPTHLFYVHLTGDELFTMQFGQMPARDQTVLPPLNTTPVMIVLPDNPELISNSETLGAISVCKEGAYLTTYRFDEHKQKEVHYVSLQDFKIHDYLPSQKRGTFTTWRLATSEANPSERTFLLSKGDWPQE